MSYLLNEAIFDLVEVSVVGVESSFQLRVDHFKLALGPGIALEPKWDMSWGQSNLCAESFLEWTIKLSKIFEVTTNSQDLFYHFFLSYMVLWGGSE